MVEYIDFYGKNLVVDSIKALLDKINIKHKNFDRTKVGHAIVAIQKATIATRLFITENGYEPNIQLSDLWHNALDKTISANIDEGLPHFLYEKARFWGEPKYWIQRPEKLTLVPKLEDLDAKCEELLNMLQKTSR